MSPGERFIHLTSGSGAADIVRHTVKRLGRDEPVVAMRDDYAEGPLADADQGAASRVQWWTKLRGGPLDPGEAERFDDADIWAHVRASKDDVVLWHGPHAMERIFALRACWHLRDQAHRVHEIAVSPSGAVWASGARPAFYDAIGLLKVSEAVAAWELRAKVVDVEERARRWETLRKREGEWIRALDDEEIVHLPVTAYDASLLDACRKGGWTPSRYVLGRVLGDHGMSSDLLNWRVRELVRTGQMEARGEDAELKLPAELRPATPVIHR